MTETPETHPALVETPPLSEEGASTSDEQEDEFQARVDRILEMIAEDPAVKDRVLVEVYVTIAEFSAQFQEMQAGIAQMGPRAFFKTMFGKG